MRNALTIPFQGAGSIIIASDNSGAIGMKKDDHVNVPYETVSYFSFRVAVMECIAAGGKPNAIVLTNFCGDEAWEKLTNGIKKGIAELELKNVVITGSTESNFSLTQSAIGVIVIGQKPLENMEEKHFNESYKIAVIGKPLVGNEVIDQKDQVAPLPLFQKIRRLDGITVWPVGSKGILSELNRVFKNKPFLIDQVISDVDVGKSSGPATCFLALYGENLEREIKRLAGSYFHTVKIVS